MNEISATLTPLSIVMAGLVPAIHDLSRGMENVDARDKPGHDAIAERLRARED